jgi:hypothetical protein
MFSRLQPTFVYTDVSSDITENDLDVVSDLWTIENRDVYRGSRDPRYTHANVYWLYDEDLQRVGCSEHDTKDHAIFHSLWFHESEFGTLLQEEGWEVGEDIWSKLPRHVFERFLNEGWTMPKSFLEQCLSSSVRIVTPSMLLEQTIVYSCIECKKKSLYPICPSNQMNSLDFPDKSKIFFVDDDLVIHIPPTSSRVYNLLLTQPQQHDDGSSLQLGQVQEQVVQLESPQTHADPPQPEQ